MTTAARWVRIISSGKSADDPRLREAVLSLREQGHRIEVRVTWEPGDAERYAREAAIEGVETVVAAGGDGTVNSVINGVYLAETSGHPSIGLIPMGTANDFAKAVGMQGMEPLTALVDIVECAPRSIDLGKAAERFFVNVASAGHAAEITAATPQETKNLLGPLAYMLTGLRYAMGVEPWPVRLTGPDFEWEGKIYGLFVGNNQLAGGGFPVCPNAVLDDGLLDITIIPDMPFEQLIALVGGLFLDRSPLARDNVYYYQLPWFEVRTEQPLQVNLDGEPVSGLVFRFEAWPKAVRMHLPKPQAVEPVEEVEVPVSPE